MRTVIWPSFNVSPPLAGTKLTGTSGISNVIIAASSSIWVDLVNLRELLGNFFVVRAKVSSAAQRKKRRRVVSWLKTIESTFKVRLYTTPRTESELYRILPSARCLQDSERPVSHKKYSR